MGFVLNTNEAAHLINPVIKCRTGNQIIQTLSNAKIFALQVLTE
jgi:hypothetical protein